MFYRKIVLGLLLALASQTARGQGSPDEVIAPFVNDMTMAIAVADLSRIEAQALQVWCLASLKQANLDATTIDQARQLLQPAADAGAAFTDAARKAGLRRVYWVATLQDLPGLLVAPLGKEADVQAVMNLLSTGDARTPAPEHGETAARRIGNCVVVGSAKKIAELQAGQASLPAMWTSALEGRPNAVFQIAFVPGEVLKRAFAENLPTLPPEIGGGATAVVTRGVRWISVSLTLPPEPAVTAVIQASDAGAVASLKELIDKDLVFLAEQKETKEMPQARQLIAALAPNVAGEQLRFVLEEQGRKSSLLPAVLIPAILRAREQAMRAESVSNIRQLVTAARMYAGEHKWEFPADMAALVKRADLPPSQWTNPRRPQQTPGYIYIRPADAAKAPDQMIIVYEAFDKWPDGIYVGYADGHVDWVSGQAEFNRQLEATQERNKMK